MSAVQSNAEALNRTERELLLCCLCPVQDTTVGDRIRELVEIEQDWDYLFLLARRHGVTPLFYSRLHSNAAGNVPSIDLQRLQKYFQENAARNVVLSAELCRLIGVLAEDAIEAIPYKGPVLALFAYEDIALRRFVDLDIMVRKEDATRAIEILLASGYEFSKPLTDSQLDVLLRTQHNVQLRRHKRQLIVELHWEVASHLFASSVQADELWQSLEPISLNGTQLRTLSTEDLIFSLCVHGSRHLWERLLWICDVGWIIARHKLNWPALLERARATHSERMFLLGLHLAAKLLRVKLPDEVSKQIAEDTQLERLALVVIASLFNGTVHKPASTSDIFRYNLRVRKTWPARMRYFRHMLNPTDRDLDAVALPRSLSFGYYLMRPFRLLFRAGEDIQ